MPAVKPLYVAGPEGIDPEWLWAWDGLCVAYEPSLSERGMDIVSSTPASLVSQGGATPVLANSPLGRTMRKDKSAAAENDYLTLAAPGRRRPTSQLTLAVVGRWGSINSFGNWSSFISVPHNDNTVTPYQSYGFQRSSSSATEATFVLTLNNTHTVLLFNHQLSEGDEFLFVGRHTAGSWTDAQVLALNGEQLVYAGVQNAGSITYDNINSPLRLFSHEHATASTVDGDIHAFYVWDRALQSSEVRQLASDPFGPIRPALTPTFYMDAGSPGPTAFFDLTNLPANFGTADTADITVRYRGQNF